jgi:hypothetical protein
LLLALGDKPAGKRSAKVYHRIGYTVLLRLFFKKSEAHKRHGREKKLIQTVVIKAKDRGHVWDLGVGDKMLLIQQTPLQYRFVQTQIQRYKSK